MFIEVPDEAEADERVAKWYEAQRQSWGYLPNYAYAFATRPDVADAWNALNGAIRDGMERRRFELATIAAARELRSTYCTAAHSKFLRDIVGDEASMRQIATSQQSDASGGSLDATDRAVMTFAAKVAHDASSVTESDVAQVRAAGLTDAEIADVVFAAAARSFFTKVLDGLGVQPDAQLADTFDATVRAGVAVGRPFATG
jgi:uncharacterized peroxidase-related enzyme